jgi:inorganic pyrophosphatase
LDINSEFWTYLDRLIANSTLVIDRPRGSAHPRFSDMIYPLDYGYLEGTMAGDGDGIDVWIGAAGTRPLTALLCTVDLVKRDAEIKLLLGCTEAEEVAVMAFHNHNEGLYRALLVRRPGKADRVV